MGVPILVAPAWPYANGPRHVGHVAGFAVPADVFARFQRLSGADVLMVSGTDEHGTPITVQADREGVSPKELADRYSASIRKDLVGLGISYDWFTRTTTRSHCAVVQQMFAQLLEGGAIFPKVTLCAFSATTGRTLPDRYIEGTCPVCGYGEARGDQCDNCGSQLDPTELIEPRSKIDGQPPVFRDSEHYFLDLPAFRQRLLEWIGGHREWRNNVRATSLNFAKDVRPRAVTRDMEWGVALPGGVEFADAGNKVIYVWFDAVIGYLSASIEWAQASGDDGAWRRWWTAEEARAYYFMGKDNIVFHTVIWPSMIMGANDANGNTLQLPSDVVSSEYLTMEGRKFSTSRGIVIYVRDLLERFQADALRYYLLAAGPETQDADFTFVEFARRTNDELLGKWGNLVQRTLTIVYRHYGAIPEAVIDSPAEQEIIAFVRSGFASVGGYIAGSQFKRGIEDVMRRVDAVNQYFSNREPWHLVKTDPDMGRVVLATVMQCISDLGVMFAPFLPFSSQSLHETLGFPGLVTDRVEVEVGPEGTDVLRRVREPLAAQWGPRVLVPGTPIEAPAGMFCKITDDDVERELRTLEGVAPIE